MCADLSGTNITGRFAGRSGGKVTITLPAGISGKNAKVLINGEPVNAVCDEKTVTFETVIAQRDGYKSYAVEFTR